MSFNAVNTVFRDGRVFSSKPYDKTIGLFMGPTILAMDGHRSIASTATWCRRRSSPRRWPAGSPRSCGRSATRLIDEFIETGEADLVRNFTFEFPTRVIAEAAGPAGRRPADVPQARGGVDQLPRQLRTGLRGVGGAEGLLPRADRAAQDPRPPRTSSAIWSPRRSTAKSSATKPSTRSCGCCCPPGWRPPTGPRATCCICCSPIPTSSPRCKPTTS